MHCTEEYICHVNVTVFSFRVVNRPSVLFTYMTLVDISTPLRLLSTIYC